MKTVRMILNDGTSPDGRQLLSRESVRMLTSNHLGDVRVNLAERFRPERRLFT